MKGISLISFMILMMATASMAQEYPKIKKSEFMTMGDNKEAWKNIKNGNKYYKKDQPGAYRLAASYYANALEYNDSYAPLLYRAGVSEVRISLDKAAMKHLDEANMMAPMMTEDCQFWLALSKQHLNMFAEAKRDFDDCSLNFGKKTAKRLSNSVSLHITQCEQGLALMKTSDLAVAQPVAGVVNSSMPEIAPAFCNLDSSLYFGSRRFEGNVSGKKRKDFDPCSDIFQAKVQNGQYFSVVNAGKPLSKKKDDYPSFVNLRGGTMYFVRKDKNIHFSNKKSLNSHWLSPTKIFKKATSFSFSSDSSMILLTSWKGKDHQGGTDIYFCKRNKKGYSKPQNIGQGINTQFDEQWATFGASDTVIYFASNGQQSVGGFDIMKASYHNGKWGRVVNMGLGINSGTDESYFQLAPGETRIGYYSSKKQGGQGDYDLYKFLLLNEPIVILPPLPYRQLAADIAKEPPLKFEEPEVIKTMRLTVVKGKVTDFDHSRNLYAQISINDNATNQTLQQVMTDPETGEFTVMLPSGRNYALTVSSDGYMFHSENFNIPATSSYQEIRKEIGLLPMDPGSKVVLNNVFFDSGKSDLRIESFGELKRLAEIFKHYPNLVIEVSGHTDNQGNRALNIQLSQQRAEAVKEFLLSIGVKEHQVQAKGYGPDQPRDTNATAEGRQNNRRVEAKIIRN